MRATIRRTPLALLLALALLVAACAPQGGSQVAEKVDEPHTQVESQKEDVTAAEVGPAPEREVVKVSDLTNVLDMRPSRCGQLHVEGTGLVDEAGERIVLKGVSTHGIQWFGDYVNSSLFGEVASWGANVVRLAVYSEGDGGWCTGGDKDEIIRRILDGVDYAREADLYAIIDWHTLTDASPALHEEEAVAFFDEVSSMVGDDAHVLYEVCNEPNGGCTWDEVKGYAEHLISVIRANAPDAVCLVGTPEWCQRPDLAVDARLSDDNVCYTAHFYAASHGQEIRDHVRAALEAGLPVFVSEFGICEASGDGALNEDEAAAWMDLLNEYDVSRVMWNLSNKEESSALISASCTQTSGLSDDDLSESGQWLRDMLMS